jgi:hypothetical protein
VPSTTTQGSTLISKGVASLEHIVAHEQVEVAVG